MSELLCEGCFTELRHNAQFCTKCGRRSPRAWHELRGLFGFFAALLVLLGVNLALADEDIQPLSLEVGITLAFTSLSAVAAIRYRATIAPLLRNDGLSARTFGLIAAAAVPIVLAVATIADGLNGFLGLAREPVTLPLRWQLLFTVVAPPLYEELLFRGAFLGTLRKHLGVRESLVISSVTFAIAHASAVSLVTHVPLGLYLGWLSLHTRSLWPSILAHAAHNLLVVVAL